MVARPIYGYERLAELYTLCDDRYGYPNNVRLAACRDCGHKFADPPWEPMLYRRSTRAITSER